MTLTITHTHAEGTLIDGTARGDGTAEILKANGWRWGRSIGAWFIPSSRDHLAQPGKIDRTAQALRGAGFTVELEISQDIRATAEVEADKAQRQAARVEALEAKAERKAGAADAAEARSQAAHDALPWGGEPIKVGHHSEGRHRNAIAKADRTMRASIEADAAADYAAARAETASHTTAARYAPVTVGNRIEKIRAEIRHMEAAPGKQRYDSERGYIDATDDQRAATTERLAPALAEQRDQLAYWEAVRAQQIAEGVAGDYSAQTITKGDLVRSRFGEWFIVERANAKTVSVARQGDGRGWHDFGTLPYHELKGHKITPEEKRAEALAGVKAWHAEHNATHAAMRNGR